MLRGWTLDDLASAVIDLGQQLGEKNLALNAKTVGRWERGETNPRAPYPKLLCALFGTSADELGLGGNRVRPTFGIDTAGVLNPRVELRPIVGALGSGLIEPLLHASPAPSVQPAHALEAPRGFDVKAAELISNALGLLRSLDDRLGSHAVVGPALELRGLVEHIARFPLSDEVRSRLRSVRAELSQFLGWLAFDAADRSTARAYYQDGLRSAQEGTQPNLCPFILGHIAILALTEGKVTEAIAVVNSQIEYILQTPCHLTRSWFSAVEAMVRAISGDPESCRAALDRSRKSFSKAEASSVPGWLYSFDRSQLMAYEGKCYERIGELESARNTWEGALILLADDRVRDRAIYSIHLASVYSRQGEIDKACLLGVEALSIATETNSARVIDELADLRVQLEPWKETKPVRNLDRLLTEVR
ncbi:MAG TPA: helix-turn-helix transcriptional regulator [Actinomycetota bacterium]|nr:helix-turn-helix transcriptional regulator [Actinomycetota bacterium]